MLDWATGKILLHLRFVLVSFIFRTIYFIFLLLLHFGNNMVCIIVYMIKLEISFYLFSMKWVPYIQYYHNGWDNVNNGDSLLKQTVARKTLQNYQIIFLITNHRKLGEILLKAGKETIKEGHASLPTSVFIGLYTFKFKPVKAQSEYSWDIPSKSVGIQRHFHHLCTLS